MPATPATPPRPACVPPAPPTLGGLLQRQQIANRHEALTRALTRLLSRTENPQLAWLNTPLPPSPDMPEGRLSPRALVLLAKALSPRRGDHVHLQGAPLALLACLLSELPTPQRPHHITLATPTPRRTRQTLNRFLAEKNRTKVHIDSLRTPRPKDLTPPDRLLVWAQESRRGVPRVETGSTIHVEFKDPLPRFLQTLHEQELSTEIDLSGHTPRLCPACPDDEPGVPLRRLLATERHQWHAWQHTPDGRIGRLVATSVDELFGNGPLQTSRAEHEHARLLFHLGYLEQLLATRSGAHALYQASLRTYASSEAWTFIGWLHAQDGHLEEAIAACENAIATDPTLGNPYNDIGAYRFALHDNDEAKTWFHRALEAPRYTAPHYPYTNLARIHLHEGDLQTARRAALNALDAHHDYTPARRLLSQIETHSDSLER